MMPRYLNRHSSALLDHRQNTSSIHFTPFSSSCLASRLPCYYHAWLSLTLHHAEPLRNGPSRIMPLRSRPFTSLPPTTTLPRRCTGEMSSLLMELFLLLGESIRKIRYGIY